MSTIWDSGPLDVSGYSLARVAARGGFPSAPFGLVVEESEDEESWAACPETSPAPEVDGGSAAEWSVPLSMRWFRLSVEVEGGDSFVVEPDLSVRFVRREE